MGKNSHFMVARLKKDDEYYTLYPDVCAELDQYKEQFRGKTIFCNCDSPDSNFIKYFKDNDLGIKELLHCHLREDGTGGFESDESIELLKKCDIVITNPPFSLFRDYMAQLIEYKKDFLVIGNMNAIAYSEIFPLAQNNQLWLGYNNTGMKFLRPDGSFKQVWAIWYTSLHNTMRSNTMKLTKTYYPRDYPEYENYPAINCDKVKDIPKDYDGIIGVPISFLYQYSPDQFEIIKFRKGNDDRDLRIKDQRIYYRILIRNKHPLKPDPNIKRLQEIAKKLQRI